MIIKPYYLVLLVTFLLCYNNLRAQKNYRPIGKSIVEFNPNTSYQSWYAGLGLQSYIGLISKVNNTGQYLSVEKAVPSTSVGFLLNAGRIFYTKPNNFFNYFDAGIQYSIIKFSETYTTNSGSKTSKQKINLNNFQLAFKFGKQFNFHEDFYVTNLITTSGTFGLASSNNLVVFNTKNYNKSLKIFADLGYELGFGIRLSKKFFLQPSINIPLITIFPFDNLPIGHSLINTKGHPIYLNIKLLLSNKDVKCPVIPLDPLTGQGKKK